MIGSPVVSEMYIILCLKHLETASSVNSALYRYDIIRKFCCQHTMKTYIAIQYTVLNTKDISSAELPTQDMTYPEKVLDEVQHKILHKY
jgi:hypothetical protein